MKTRTVILVSLGILVVGLVVGGMSTCSMRRQRDAAIRQAALNDSLHKTDEGRYKRAAVELENVRQMRAAYRDSFPDLYEENRELKAKERVYIQTIVSLRADTASVTATDTVYVSTEGINISRVDFQLEYDGATVTGHTTTPPPRAEARIEYKQISLTVLVSQLRDRSWQANVETAPWVEISALNTQVVPYRPGWWTRHKFEIGIGLGAVGMLLIFSAIGG